MKITEMITVKWKRMNNREKQNRAVCHSSYVLPSNKLLFNLSLTFCLKKSIVDNHMKQTKNTGCTKLILKTTQKNVQKKQKYFQYKYIQLIKKPFLFKTEKRTVK